MDLYSVREWVCIRRGRGERQNMGEGVDVEGAVDAAECVFVVDIHGGADEFAVGTRSSSSRKP
jgi:hypothetical protein